MIIADLHIHTCYSDGIDPPEAIVKASQSRGIHVIAITDHDTVRGYHRLRELGLLTNTQIVVIPGIEITTREGHVLGLGVDTEPPFRVKPSAVEAIEWIHSAGGIAIAAHPFGCAGFLPCGFTKKQETLRLFDGIEAVNGRTLPRGNKLALELARSLGKPITCGSDAHRVEEVGTAYIIVEDDIVDPSTEPIEIVRHILSARVKPSEPPSLHTIIKNIVLRRIERIIHISGCT